MIEQSYARNRQNFLDAAKKAGAKLAHIPYTRSVETDVELVTDVALLGSEDAENVVIVASGLHGVELPAGSLLQQLWLKKLQTELSSFPNTRFVFVHALNPHGAHFGMRTDWDIAGQGNIDPARNFIDFKEAINTANFDISRIMKDADLSCFSWLRMWCRLLYSAFVEQGKKAFKEGFVRGQYTDPEIPYFGGAAPTISRVTWEHIVTEYAALPHVKKIWHLDCHTGDGPFGVLQLYINDREGGHVFTDASHLMVPERIQMTGKYFANISGDIVDYWANLNPHGAEVTPMTLEFGTSSSPVEGMDVLNAILTRTILQQKYADQHRKGGKIIQKMRDAFAPRTVVWREKVSEQAEEFWNKLSLVLSGK